MSRTFSSLAVAHYRTYFIGLSIASIGNWMSMTAKTWLVLTVLTDGDATALGWLTGLMFAPALLFLPLTASVADRFPKRLVVLAGFGFNVLNGVILTALVLTGRCELWHVFLLSFLDGTANAFAMPAQQAFVAELVPRAQLANAISLNSASFNAARLLGPGLAGVLIALTSTGAVLATGVAMTLPLIGALVLIRASDRDAAPLQRGGRQLAQGLSYVRGRPDLMLLIGVAFMMGNFGFNFAISNALMATEAFGMGPGEFGALGSAMGVGALAAALWSARREHARMRHILAGLAVFAGMSAVSALSPSYVVFAVTMVPLGFAAIAVIITANTLVQTHVAGEFRGRVMAVWSALLLGGTPVIAPMVGWLGAHLGARATVWFEGISIAVTFVVTFWLAARHHGIKLRLDPRARPTWLVLERGEVTEEVAGGVIRQR